MELTQEQLKIFIHYNPDTGIFTWINKTSDFSNANIGDIAGTKDRHGYIVITLFGKRHLSHRLAFLYMTGEWPKDQVDHINRIRSDNKWCNLRESSHIENHQNKHSNTVVNYNGTDMSLKQACRLHGIKYQTVRTRLRNHDCTPDEAMLIPSAGKSCDVYANNFSKALEKYREQNGD